MNGDIRGLTKAKEYPAIGGVLIETRNKSTGMLDVEIISKKNYQIIYKLAPIRNASDCEFGELDGNLIALEKHLNNIGCPTRIGKPTDGAASVSLIVPAAFEQAELTLNSVERQREVAAGARAACRAVSDRQEHQREATERLMGMLREGGFTLMDNTTGKEASPERLAALAQKVLDGQSQSSGVAMNPARFNQPSQGSGGRSGR